MNIVISDGKTGKAYSKKIDDPAVLMNKRIGEEIDLSPLGVTGYSAKITGGSDKEGFPMKADLQGTMRRKVLLSSKERKGLRKRVTKRGNIVAKDIHQLNVVVTKAGSKKLEELVGKVEKKEEVSAKESAMTEKVSIEEAQAAALEKKGKKRN